MVNETQKILHKSLEVSATCVRVGVLRSHSEALTLHFESEVNAKKAREILAKAPSVVVMDEPQNKKGSRYSNRIFSYQFQQILMRILS